MPFTLLPNEEMLNEIVFEDKFLLFVSESVTINLTTHRLVETHRKRGSEITKIVPLEMIDSMEEGRFSKPRWLYAAAILVIAGIVLSLTLIGAIAGIPMIIAGVICFVIYIVTQKTSAEVRSSTTIVYGPGGGRFEGRFNSRRFGGETRGGSVDTWINLVESARQQRTDRMGGNESPDDNAPMIPSPHDLRSGA